jgi:hypothetical protein
MTMMMTTMTVMMILSMRSFLPVIGFQVLTTVTMEGVTVFWDVMPEGRGTFFEISVNFYWTT